MYLPGLHALARGSPWQEPASVPACCDSLPSLLVQIEAAEINSQKHEMLACILSCGCRAATHVEEQQKAVRGKSYTAARMAIYPL